MNHKPYVVLEKEVGKTPLETVEFWRSGQDDSYHGIPLAYAGRLDPMASGSLLVLIGEECKVQEQYHSLDKTYRIRVLFGAHSDSGDVLGLISESGCKIIDPGTLREKSVSFIGAIELPYPIFSSRTVQGKPLHTWTLEGRLGEITIPTKKSTIFELSLIESTLYTREEVYKEATEKIALLPTVTDPRKALGNDFRRPDVLRTWDEFRVSGLPRDEFSVATFVCTASSGTYMRTLAEELAKSVASTGLAFSIHRETIGRYDPEAKVWKQKFV